LGKYKKKVGGEMMNTTALKLKYIIKKRYVMFKIKLILMKYILKSYRRI